MLRRIERTFDSLTARNKRDIALGISVVTAACFAVWLAVSSIFKDEKPICLSFPSLPTPEFVRKNTAHSPDRSPDKDIILSAEP